MDEADEDPSKGAVYIFDLDKKYDLDGSTAKNIAKFINHSCDPNCESVNDDGEICAETDACHGNSGQQQGSGNGLSRAEPCGNFAAEEHGK